MNTKKAAVLLVMASIASVAASTQDASVALIQGIFDHFSELPYYELKTCNFGNPGIEGLGAGQLCSLKTVAETTVWLGSADENCRGPLAEQQVRELGTRIAERGERWARLSQSLDEASPETRTEVYRTIAEIMSQLPGQDSGRTEWITSGHFAEALHRYVATQKQFNNDERAVLYEYFQNGYWRLNQVLYREDLAKCIQPYTSAFLSLLKRLPKHRGTTWSGSSMSPERLNQFAVGQEQTWKGFTSTSVDRKVAESFAKANGTNVPVLYKIQTRNCIDVRGVSDKLREQEVLCPPGTRVRVVGRESQNIVLIEEIE